MLKNNIEIIYKIIKFTPDTEKRRIDVEIATGKDVDGNFVSDGRDYLKFAIVNMPDKSIYNLEALTVNAAGQVLLSFMPIDDNQIQIDGIAQDHDNGQFAICANNSENDNVEVGYYHTVSGRNWFDEQAVFVKEDNLKYAGMNDYEYNSNRIWDVLLEMGLMSGNIV